MKNQARSDIGPFAIVPLWLIQSGVTPGAVTCFALMWAKWADKEGECWPSHASIAKEMDVSERSARNYLAELTEVGALQVVNRLRDDGSQTSNLYVLNSVRGVAASCQGGGSQLPGGVAMSCQGGWQPVADEPYPEEPDPMNPSSSSASQPTAMLSGDVSMSDDSDKIESVDEGTLNDQGAGLSYPEDSIHEEVSRARTILIEEGYDPEGVENALTGKSESGGVTGAAWTEYRGKTYDSARLADSVRLAVAFADACDEAGNKRPNPYTHKECLPMRMLLMTDEKQPKHIRLLIRWTFNDDFWSTNVRCTKKFREKWDQLAGARRRDLKKQEGQQARDAGATGEDWMARMAQ